MSLSNIKVSGRGMTVSKSIRGYVLDKLSKYDRIFDIATSIDVELTESLSNRGVKSDYRIEILMHLPKVDVRVEKEGPEMYALIDEITDVLARKIKSYRAKLRQWEGKDSWKLEEVKEDKENDNKDKDPYVIDYVPRIARRKKIEDGSPISEAEAIEKMEMMGYDAFLFKSIENKKYCMVYRRKKGGYGIVESC